MIPQFNRHGELPVGIHDTSWTDFKTRFGGNSHREQTLNKIEAWLLHMIDARCRVVFIDGSFVTEKAEPGDFDACWDGTDVEQEKLDDCLLFYEGAPETIKDRFGGDIRPDRAIRPGSIGYYVTFFQSDARTGRKKGIVRLDLSEGLI